MFTRMLLYVMALMPFTAALQGEIASVLRTGWSKNETPPPPTIRVMVMHDQKGVGLEVRGKYNIVDPHTQEILATRFKGKSQLIQALSSGLKWGEEFPGIHQVEIIPTSPE